MSDDGHPLSGAFTFRVGGTGYQSAVAALVDRLLGERDGAPGIGAGLHDRVGRALVARRVMAEVVLR